MTVQADPFCAQITRLVVKASLGNASGHCAEVSTYYKGGGLHTNDPVTSIYISTDD